MYDSASKHIFTFNGRTKDSTVVDPATANRDRDRSDGRPPQNSPPRRQWDDLRNIEDTNEVVVLDSRTAQDESPVATCTSGNPYRAGLGCETSAVVSSEDATKCWRLWMRTVVKSCKHFPLPPASTTIIYDADSGLLYASTREAIHIFHEDTPDKFTEVETVKTEFGGEDDGPGYAPHRLFVDTADFGPPPPATPEEPHPESERVPTPGTFRLLIYGR